MHPFACLPTACPWATWISAHRFLRYFSSRAVGEVEASRRQALFCLVPHGIFPFGIAFSALSTYVEPEASCAAEKTARSHRLRCYTQLRGKQCGFPGLCSFSCRNKCSRLEDASTIALRCAALRSARCLGVPTPSSDVVTLQQYLVLEHASSAAAKLQYQ